MDKNLHRQESKLTLKNHNPGCMWGILHHFQHNRWHNVVKRLPRGRLTASGKHSTADQDKVQHNIEPSVQNHEVEAKVIVPSPAHKSSMKSRLKALITDEMYRKKGRHRRSSTYPSRKPLDKTIPIHNQVISSTTESPTGKKSIKCLCDSHDHNVHSPDHSDDPLLPKTGEENSDNNITSCEMCDTMVKVNYLKQNEVIKLGKEPVRDHTYLLGNSIYAVEPSNSIQESKLFMDALDLLNVRQEVFMKILQDPSSSLAHQLHFRRTPNLKFGLTKSVSFPAPEKREFKPENSTLSHCSNERGENGNPQQFSQDDEPSDDMLEKKNENKAVLKSFKTIREKLKYVIRDKKKEKNRIVKDALHHKIPCDRNVSTNESQLVCGFVKSPVKPFKRTSSFNDSYARYNQLLEISTNKKGTDHTSDRSRFNIEDAKTPVRKSPAILSRILSLPDLRSYSSIQIDDSASNNVIMNEQKPLDLGSSGEVQISSISDSGIQENMLDVGETFDDQSADLKTSESASSRFDLNLEHELCSALQPSKLDENDYKYQEYEMVQEIELPVLEEEDFSGFQKDYPTYEPSTATQETVGMGTEESQVQQFFNDLMQVQVDTKNEAEFNYVKDILELSGFSRDEALGKWHSPDVPLDPLMFEEVEGCSIDQSECEEAYRNNDHLLLFDIINEILLGIHERSICYWPRTLTSLARIHQLPKGNRVLEEVWAEIRWLLSWRPEGDQGSIDDAVSRDLARDDGWMNVQLDAECVGLELEDLILEDLLDEIMRA